MNPPEATNSSREPARSERGVPPTGYWRREHLSRPLRLADLTDDLLWPGLLRAGPLALRPERLLLALFMLLIVTLLWRATIGWSGSGTFAEDGARAWAASADSVSKAWSAGGVTAVIGAGAHAVVVTLTGFVRAHLGTALLLALTAAPVLAIGGGAISRLCAAEFSQCVMLSWTDALGFALRRAGSLVGAWLAPPALVLGVVVLLAGSGWLLLSWGGVNIVGAVLYPLALLASLIAVLVLVGYALGQPLLGPAVACENTDAIDAIQRTYAYVVASPLRLALYAAILVAQFTVLFAVLSAILGLTVAFAAWACSLWGGADVADLLQGVPGKPGTWQAAGRVISFWVSLPAAFLGAFALSYFSCGSTIVYLLLRRLNDGQDPADIWMPGLVGGTLAPADEAMAAGSDMPDDE